MLNILSNFDSVEKGNRVGSTSVVSEDKNAMKTILENLQSAQVFNETDQDDDYEPSMRVVQTVNGPQWVPTQEFDIGDHVHLGHATKGGAGVSGKVVKIQDGKVYIKGDHDNKLYSGWIKNAELVDEDIIAQRKPRSDVHKKENSFVDVLKSLEETEEEKKKRLEKELYNNLQKEKKLKKANNGKYELTDTINESEVTGLTDLKAVIDNICFFGDSMDSIKEEFRVNNGDTFIALAKKIVKAVQDIRKQNGK